MKQLTKEYSEAFKRVCVARKDYYWEYTPKPFLQKDNDTPRYLGDSVINDHIKGIKTIGLTMFVDNENVLYGGIDLDAHGDTKKEQQLVNKDLTKLKKELSNKKYLYFVNSSGSDGRHIRIYSNKPTNAKVMRYFLIDLQERILGECRHEVFPKQDCLSEKTPFGNQMKSVLAIHPRTKLLAGMIEGKNVLDVEKSLKNLVKFSAAIPTAKEIKFKITQQLEVKHTKKSFNGVVETTIKNNVPSYCAGFEEIACTQLLPSGKATRHNYLDGNAFQYLSDKPELFRSYCEIQGRDHTAFNGCGNWSWKCQTIHTYLRENSGTGIEQWKDKCSTCPLYSKEYLPALKNIIEHRTDVDKCLRMVEDLLKNHVDSSPLILDRLLTEISLITGTDIKTLQSTLNYHKNNKRIDLDELEKTKQRFKAQKIVEFHEQTIQVSDSWSDELMLANIKKFFHENGCVKLARYLVVSYLLRKFKIICEYKTDKIKLYDSQLNYFKDVGVELVQEFLTSELNINNTRTNAIEILHLLKTKTYVDDDAQRKSAPLNLIPFKNGVLDLKTMQLLKHDPKYLFDYQHPIEYKPEAKCPNIDAFFKQLVPEEAVDLLYDIFGLILYRENFLEKFFVFTGGGSNGKSRVLIVIQKFIGDGNHSNISLRQMTEDRFAVAKTHKKNVNIGSDIGGQPIRDTSMLKAACSTDQISGQFKFGDIFDFTPTATQLFAANDPPVFVDDSDGMYRRAELILFPNQFGNDKDIAEDPTYKKADPNIVENVTTHEEMSGLLNKAVEHLKKIFTTSQLSVTRSTSELRKNYVKYSNSIKAFLEEMCEECNYVPAEYEKIKENKITRTILIEPASGYIFVADLYDGYKLFCEREKLQVKTLDFFGKRIVKDSGWELDKQKDLVGETTTKKRSVRGLTWSETKTNENVPNPPIPPNPPNPAPLSIIYTKQITTKQLEEANTGQVGLVGQPEPISKNDTTTTKDDEEEIIEEEVVEDDITGFLSKNKDKNALLVEDKFGVEQVQQWLKEGVLMENPSGTYRIL